MGQFQSGQGKPVGSGRKKGTPNKRTQRLLSSMQDEKFNILRELSKLLPQLPIEKQADVLLELMPYVYPKRKPADDITQTVNNEPQVIISIPSNGREAPGTKLYTQAEADKILNE